MSRALGRRAENLRPTPSSASAWLGEAGPVLIASRPAPSPCLAGLHFAMGQGAD